MIQLCPITSTNRFDYTSPRYRISKSNDPRVLTGLGDGGRLAVGQLAAAHGATGGRRGRALGHGAPLRQLRHVIQLVEGPRQLVELPRGQLIVLPHGRVVVVMAVVVQRVGLAVVVVAVLLEELPAAQLLDAPHQEALLARKLFPVCAVPLLAVLQILEQRIHD